MTDILIEIQEARDGQHVPHKNNALRKAAAEIARLREERNSIARHVGVCMACIDGASQPHGCTDCLGTGWNQGEDPIAEVATLRSQLTAAHQREREAVEALKPFAEEADKRAKLCLGADIDHWPIGGSALTLGDLRRASAAYNSANQASAAGIQVIEVDAHEQS